MSVAGRNAIRGSLLTVYRATQAEGTGGQTTLSWAVVRQHARFELHQRTAEMLRLIYGVDSQVELVAYAEANADLRAVDVLLIHDGPYAGDRYRVVRTLRSRKYLELGLQRVSADEVIP